MWLEQWRIPPSMLRFRTWTPSPMQRVEVHTKDKTAGTLEVPVLFKYERNLFGNGIGRLLLHLGVGAVVPRLLLRKPRQDLASQTSTHLFITAKGPGPVVSVQGIPLPGTYQILESCPSKVRILECPQNKLLLPPSVRGRFLDMEAQAAFQVQLQNPVCLGENEDVSSCDFLSISSPTQYDHHCFFSVFSLHHPLAHPPVLPFPSTPLPQSLHSEAHAPLCVPYVEKGSVCSPPSLPYLFSFSYHPIHT